MPASYAHYRFGKQLLPTLPPDVRQCVQRFRRMYDAGLQGPDFFFYYNPLVHTATGALGNTFHSQSGQEFFTTACAAATSEAARAYLYGLLGHYCLDAACHPFVNRLAADGKADHVALESELERFFLEADGEAQPHTFNAGRFLKLTRGECMTVAEFYPGSTGAKVHRGIHLMALSLRLLAHPNRRLQERLLQKTAPRLLLFRIPEQTSQALTPYVAELSRLFEVASARYPGLLEEIEGHRQTGSSLSLEFAPNFG